MTPEDVCSINWGTVFDSGKDVLVAVAEIFLAVVAWRGISTWRTEYRLKANFEAARTVAKALYGLRDALDYARQAMVVSSEYPPGFAGFGNSSATENAECYAHVFENRLKPALSAAIDLQTARHEAQALWGKDAKDLIDKVLKCVQELRVAMQAFVANEEHAGKHFEADPLFGDDTRAMVYATTIKFSVPEENLKGVEISRRIEAVDLMLQQHLRIEKSSKN